MTTLFALGGAVVRASFRPEQAVCAVRTLLRHRKQWGEMPGPHLQSMHKALDQTRSRGPVVGAGWRPSCAERAILLSGPKGVVFVFRGFSRRLAGKIVFR